MARVERLLDDARKTPDPLGWNHNGDLNLRKQLHLIILIDLVFLGSLLDAAAKHLGECHAADMVLAECLLQYRKLGHITDDFDSR